MKIIADVYEFNIMEDEFEYAKVLFSNRNYDPKENEKRAIDYLIDRYLLLHEATKFGTEVTDDEWNDKLFEISQQFETKEEYYKYLDQHKLSRIKYENALKENLAIYKFLDKFSHFIKDLVAQDVSSFADAHSELFSCCARAHAYNILLIGSTDENFKKLMQIREQIKTLEDFKIMADKHSECPLGVDCGDMGYVESNALIEELDSIIFSIPLNEVSLPTKSKFGYHLILVTERTSNEHLSDIQKKDFMLSCMVDDKAQLYLHSYLDLLRKDADANGEISYRSS